ncbi:unnamed protein product, partial [Ixodes hexagonus]
QVSWIRRRDLHVLTVGRFTYTSDQRFQTIHMDNSDSWMLQIQYPQKKDAGVYECQVSTLPKISRFVTLNIIGERRPSPDIHLISTSFRMPQGEAFAFCAPVTFWFKKATKISAVYSISQTSAVLTKAEARPRGFRKFLVCASPGRNNTSYRPMGRNRIRSELNICVYFFSGENPAAMQHGKHTASANSHSASCGMTMLAAVALLLDVGLRWR